MEYDETRIEPPKKKTRKSTPSRKKACNHCTDAKARCDMQRPCSRCIRRVLHCEYLTGGPVPSGSLVATNEKPAPDMGQCGVERKSSTGYFGMPTPPDVAVTRQPEAPDAQNAGVNFSDLELAATIDSSRIRDRWMESFLPTQGQRLKVLQPYTIQFISSILRNYHKHMFLSGGHPPIIHRLQLDQMPVPLANCYTLVRMWEGRVPGSEALVVDTVKNEMRRLLEEYQSYEQLDLLAAFQAYLLFAMMLYFSSSQTQLSLIDHTTTVNLQEIASYVSATGLVCTAELTSSRPKWESWITASAKRRTLYAWYLFDNVINFQTQTPTYIAEEMRAVPVPASKVLWDARDRDVWEREYDMHLSQWAGCELLISELWLMGEPPTEERQKRIDRWVRSVDEFGMMLFAVTAHIHGC